MTKTQRLKVKILFVKYAFNYWPQFERSFLLLGWVTVTLCDCGAPRVLVTAAPQPQSMFQVKTKAESPSDIP